MKSKVRRRERRERRGGERGEERERREREDRERSDEKVAGESTCNKDEAIEFDRVCSSSSSASILPPLQSVPLSDIII